MQYYVYATLPFFGHRPSALSLRPSANILALGLWPLATGLVGLSLVIVAHSHGEGTLLEPLARARGLLGTQRLGEFF